MNLVVFGAGYVGLVTGVCFAHMGNQVTCVDIDKQKVKSLQQGRSPLFEPGLQLLLEASLEAGNLSFNTQGESAIQDAEIILIAVGTPAQADGQADLNGVLQVANTIAEQLTKKTLVVIKSTVPVGTGDKVEALINQRLQALNQSFTIEVVSNPEFLKEGSAVNDCMKPDRIIVGTHSRAGAEQMQTLYQPFNRNRDRVLLMDRRSAELTKYAANAMLATKISFMNEMSQVAQRVEADIEQVRLGIGADTRIGYDFIYPGCGYGGSCFPKDVSALEHLAQTQDYQPQLLTAVQAINANQKQELFKQISQYFSGQLAGKTLALWGVAFKPNTDDIRESSSRVLIESLWAHGARVNLYDPEALANFKQAYGERDDYTCCNSPQAALQGADALVIVTEWPCFRSPNFKAIQQTLKHPVIFDGRNLYQPKVVAQYGLNYYSIGRKAVHAHEFEEVI